MDKMNGHGANSWYFVEDFDPELDYNGAKVLALTPEACFMLGKKGVRYHIIEDHYDEREIRSGEDAYLKDQLAWFRDFDRLFKDALPSCREDDIRLASAHIYQIKFFVDSIVIQARVFDRFFKGNRPMGGIVYVSREKAPKPAPDIYDIYNNRRDFLMPLARKAAELNGVDFSLRKAGPSEIPSRPGRSAIGNVKNGLKRMRFKEVYDFFKYGKATAMLGARRASAPMKILFLHAGCATIDELLKELISDGDRVFLKTNKDIYLLSGISEKNVLSLESVPGSEETSRLREILTDVHKKFSENPSLAGWINEKSGLDVGDLVLPYFRYFSEETCLSNLYEMPRLRGFLEKEGIDFVVARSSSEKESVSSLIAAARSGKRVCFQHSCGAFDSGLYDITELNFFDHYFAMHGEAEEHMKIGLERDYITGCNVFQDPRHIESVRRRWKDDDRDDKLVLYVPTKLFTGFRGYNETYSYPVTWYYSLQKALVDMFARQDGFRFIFKYAEGQEWSRDSILKYLGEKGYKNISVEKRKLADCLGKAGRAILDCPSTGLYEAAAAGIPVMCLYRDTLRLRNISRKLFGRSLREFSDIPQAVKAAEEFLDCDPSGFKADIPTSGKNSVEVLLSIKNEYAVGEGIVRGKVLVQ